MTTAFRPESAAFEPPMADCWRHVGTGGDRSCPELARFIHCRNCPVVAAAARRFFDRPAPPGYLDACGALLELPERPPAPDSRSVLVFRLGGEWFGIPTSALVQVLPCRRVHRIPHRARGALGGIANVDGRLTPCVLLERILGVERPTPTGADGSTTARMLVLQRSGRPGDDRWVIAADEVAGVASVPAGSLRNIPATAGGTGDRATASLFSWHDRTVGLLDETRLLACLSEAVAE